MLFFAGSAVNDLPPGALAGILAVMVAFLAVAGIFLLVYYVFMGFAYMAIAKKAKQSSPGLSWIPLVGPLIIAFKSAKMHWWPWLLIIGMFLPILGGLCSLVFAVYVVIWHWKMFEKIGKPGWWAILMLIPLVNFVVIGIAAWSKK